MDKVDHLPHLEDLAFLGDDNTWYALEIVTTLCNLINFNDTQGISVKVDGAPSVVFGYLNGQFFVATKAFFNKVPKICYTEQDIERYHSRRPGLVHTLKVALKYLPSITPHGIHQGDILFTREDLEFSPNYVRFTPNVITYTTYKGIPEELGISVHTTYETPVPVRFKSTADVFVYDTTVKLNLTNTIMCPPLFLNGSTVNDPRVIRYINSTVRNDTQPSYHGYLEYLESRKEQLIKEGDYHVSFDLFHALTLSKHQILETLNTREDEFAYSINGEKCNEEGYVVKYENLPMVKLVNRSEFSRANFLKVRE